jgi:hypothetical protein
VDSKQQVCISFPAVSETYHGDEAELIRKLLRINSFETRQAHEDRRTRGISTPEGVPVDVSPTIVLRESPLKKLSEKVNFHNNALAEASTAEFSGYVHNEQIPATSARVALAEHSEIAEAGQVAGLRGAGHNAITQMSRMWQTNLSKFAIDLQRQSRMTACCVDSCLLSLGGTWYWGDPAVMALVGRTCRHPGEFSIDMFGDIGRQLFIKWLAWEFDNYLWADICRWV